MKALILLVTALMLTGCFDYSDGDRIGTVIKLSRKGLVCKTWEGQMYLGGLKKQTNSSSDGQSTTTSMVANTWDFTVEDETLLPAIRKAMETGVPITLRYRQELVTLCRSDSDGDYFVTAADLPGFLPGPDVPRR